MRPVKRPLWSRARRSLTDTFTSASDIALASYTGPMGTWVKNRSADGPTVSITASTGRARSSSTITSTVYRVGAMPTWVGTDYRVSATIFFASQNYGGVGARTNAADRVGYYFNYSLGVPGWLLSRGAADGSTTALITSADVLAPAAGVRSNVELEVRGTGSAVTLKGYVDGVLILTYVDTDPARIVTQGYAAIYPLRQAAEFDTFTVSSV